MKTLQWKTEKRKIKDLIPMEVNPRKITQEKLDELKRNMEKFNVVEIPVIDIDNTLVTYHQRLKALLLLGRGEEDIDVRIPDRKLTETEIKEYNLIGNTHSGQFDMELFEEYFSGIDLDGIGVDLGDIDLSVKVEDYLELQRENKRARILEAKEDDYELPDQIQTDIVSGDLFEIGRHRLLCGNSRISDDVARLMNGRLADICITDPPYNVDYVGKTKDALKIDNDSMSATDFYQLLYDAHVNIFSFIKPGSAVYVFHADSEGENFRKAYRSAGLKLTQCLVWVKQSMVMGRSDYQWRHEPILYGWKEGSAHRWFTDRRQTTVLEFDRPTRSLEHPTMKPINIIAYFLENSSEDEEVLIDLFGGAGSTMVAAEQLDRSAYLMELNPKYCQATVDRMRKLVPAIKILRNGKPI